MRAGRLAVLLGLVGCVSDPTFEQVSGATTTASDPTVSTTDDMVLVPMTTLSTVTTQADKGKGKGKGNDDDDDKKPSPSPSPSPAPAPTPAPAPAPAPSAGSVVVPAFWIDRAPVSSAEYDACVKTGLCTVASCPHVVQGVTCITHAQARAFCAWNGKRLVRDVEWTAAAKQSPAGLTGLQGGPAEWVDATGGGDTRIARGGATSSASMSLGLDSSIPTVGFRCARDR